MTGWIEENHKNQSGYLIFGKYMNLILWKDEEDS
jgi:hypothetical protein